MSLVRCDDCEKIVDSDYDCECFIGDKAICECCREKFIEALATSAQIP